VAEKEKKVDKFTGQRERPGHVALHHLYAGHSAKPSVFPPLSQLGQVAKASVFLLGTSGHSVVSTTTYIR
jgi:hypothetical protein